MRRRPSRRAPARAKRRQEYRLVLDHIDLHFGRRLRRRRRLMGLTQQQLAMDCGVGFQQIQKYECGFSRMSAARLWRLSKALGVEMGYFSDGLVALAAARPPEVSAKPAPAGQGAGRLLHRQHD